MTAHDELGGVLQLGLYAKIKTRPQRRDRLIKRSFIQLQFLSRIQILRLGEEEAYGVDGSHSRLIAS